MDDLVGGFQKYLSDAGVSYRTRSGYSSDIRTYLQTMTSSAGHLLPGAFAAVTAGDIERHLNDLSCQGARHSTLKRSLAGIRRFFDYLVTDKVVAKNPTDDLVLTVADERVLAEGQVLSIFRFLRLRSREVPPRRALGDELVLMLLIFGGLRQGQLSMLTATSFRPLNGVLEMRLNGHPATIVDGPVLGHLGAFLRRYAHGSAPLLLNQKKTRTLLREIASGLSMELDHVRLRRTYLWLRANPDVANSLLGRIEDIHE